MKLKLLIGFLAIIVILSGCSNGDESGEKASSRVKLEDVTQALETGGLKLLQIHPKGGTSPFAQINDVGETFAIDTYRMGDVTDEISSSITSYVNLYIYVFDSDKARIEGRSALNDKLARVNMVAPPSVFENKNILLIHFNGNDEKDKQYDQMIQSVISGL
ncbi:hypothetical protein H8B09_12085 [Paenibacillus sp. PR3]|uniref:Lipoprotein n=1 Tax=Paenibacillus terricola TaxID=2763503 RepID=A0ABR8MU65_9BACL|nr:hypothetical protein [Paenibacillus terricola]MBD3919494.1 hypothetical protein [Paenibacillus terricola]